MPIYGSGKYGQGRYGGPRQKPLRAKPLIAHCYTAGFRLADPSQLGTAVNAFKKSFTVLQRPVIKQTLNAGYHPLTLELVAQDTSASAPSQGDVVRLTEQGGDGTVLYTGIVEDIVEDQGFSKVSHQVQLQPLVTDLGNTPVNKSYTSGTTDVAQMVRDAVSASNYLTWTAQSIPNTGFNAVYYFQHTTALDVLTVCRQIAGYQYFWFVDAVGVVWFQKADSTRATFKLKRGQDYRGRQNSSPIAQQLNHLVCVGAVPPGGTAPLTAIYDGLTSQGKIGVRAAKSPYVYKTVTDQATLNQIRTTLGNTLDRQVTKGQVKVNNYPSRITLGQPSAATLAYWEPVKSPVSLSFAGSGTYSPNYVILDVQDDGVEQTVIYGDIPVNGANDLRYEIDRIIQRTALDSLFNTPVSGTQVQTLAGGGYQTAADPAPGVPSVGRIKADGTAIRGFDGSSTDYGLPDGVGETFRLGVDGVAWFAKILLQSAKSGAQLVLDAANAIFRINDGTRDRVAFAVSLPAYTDPNGVTSPAGAIGRLVDSNGNLLWDSSGISQTMADVASAAAAGTGSTNTGTGSYQTVSGTSVSFTLTRKTKVLILATMMFIDNLVGDTGYTLTGSIMVDGSPVGPVIYNLGNASSSLMSYAVVTLASGTHTAALAVNQTSGKQWVVGSGTAYLDVFQLGG